MPTIVGSSTFMSMKNFMLSRVERKKVLYSRGQVVKDLTCEKQDRPSMIQDRSGNVLLRNKRFSADVENIAQNFTTTRVVVTMQVWTVVRSQKKIFIRSFVRKLRLQ